MRLWIVVGLLGVLAACDPYLDVQRADTIEAYTAYLAEHPDGANAFKARVRLEELVLQQARTTHSKEAWDDYLQRFPEGNHREVALKEREVDLFAWADWEATPEAWTLFLAEYPASQQGRAAKAKKSLAATQYGVHMTMGPMRVTRINLAEDPEGPLDGSRFEVDVTNDGDRTVEMLRYRIHYLDAEGRSSGSRTWPLVATYREFPVPVPPEQCEPMVPGETRTWTWETGDLPGRFAGAARLVPYEIRLTERP